MSEWQPIETAPKDGSKLDLWCIFQKTGSKRVTDAYWNIAVNGWQLGDYNEADYMHPPKITHWMPLPEAPDVPKG